MVLLPSCVFEKIQEEPEEIPGDKSNLVIRIKTLDASEGTPSDEATETEEKISTLRIIMINEKDEIECNERINLESTDRNQYGDALYYFIRVTTPGIKKFYLFANEDEVKRVEGISSSSDLKSFLSQFVPSTTEATSSVSSGVEFESEIKSAYFTPDFRIENNRIKLPYTAFYTLEMKGGEVNEKTMYLVPAATKLYFNFTNSRTYDVDVTQLGFSKIADRSYLLGKVGNKDYTKNLEGKDHYWIDWLARISELSNENFEPNISFNEKYGWIKDYEIPSETAHNDFMIYDSKITDNGDLPDNSDSFLRIPGVEKPGGGYSPIPGTKKIGPFYLSESLFIPDEETSEQHYYLQLQLKDNDPDSELQEFPPIPLSNIGALFRNTKIVVNISFNEGNDDIYAEIRSWYSTENFYGTLVKSTETSNSN